MSDLRSRFSGFLFILIFMLILGVSTAEDVQASQSDSMYVDITMWSAVPQRHRTMFKNMVDEYLETNHGMVKVHHVFFDNQQEIHEELLNGTRRPDIAIIDNEWQKAIHEKHEALFMEDIVKNFVGNSLFISFKNDTYKQMWDSSLYNDKLLTMPFYGVNRALIVNRDILDQHQIKDKPANLKELIAAAKKISEDKRHKAFYIPISEGAEEMARFYQVLLWQQGKDIWEAFMDGELSGFHNNEGKSAINILYDMIYTHKIASSDKVSKQDCAFFIATPDEYLTMLQNGVNVEIISWPGISRSGNNLSVKSFMVFKGADDRKVEKMWQLIYFLSEFKNNLKWSLATPYLPPNKQIVLSPFYFQHMEARPGLRIFLQQLANSRMNHLDMRKYEAMNLLGETLLAVIANRVNTEEFLQTAAKNIDLVLDPEGKLRKQRDQLQDLDTLIQTFWNRDYGM